MHVCFVPLLLINIDGKSQRNHRGPDVRAAVEQPGEGDILRESVTMCKWAIKSQFCLVDSGRNFHDIHNDVITFRIALYGMSGRWSEVMRASLL